MFDLRQLSHEPTDSCACPFREFHASTWEGFKEFLVHDAMRKLRVHTQAELVEKMRSLGVV